MPPIPSPWNCEKDRDECAGGLPLGGRGALFPTFPPPPPLLRAYRPYAATAQMPQARHARAAYMPVKYAFTSLLAESPAARAPPALWPLVSKVAEGEGVALEAPVLAPPPGAGCAEPLALAGSAVGERAVPESLALAVGAAAWAGDAGEGEARRAAALGEGSAGEGDSLLEECAGLGLTARLKEAEAAEVVEGLAPKESGAVGEAVRVRVSLTLGVGVNDGLPELDCELLPVVEGEAPLLRVAVGVADSVGLEEGVVEDVRTPVGVGLP